LGCKAISTKGACRPKWEKGQGEGRVREVTATSRRGKAIQIGYVLQLNAELLRTLGILLEPEIAVIIPSGSICTISLSSGSMTKIMTIIEGIMGLGQVSSFALDMILSKPLLMSVAVYPV